MEYHPKHPQPFSFSEALQLDPGTITEEIARLQNSLKHLKETQDELRPLTDDPELAQALRENEAVMSVCPPPLSAHYLIPNTRSDGCARGVVRLRKNGSIC